MATGDKVLAVRPRAESNMRFDLVDFTRMAQTAQLNIYANNRAVVASPKATAGSLIGERWTGSITKNPTGPSDGLLRVDSATFIGLDADGGLVLKPNGTSLSVAIPSGGASYQVYLYMQDVSEDAQVRRKIPATAPFTEFQSSINVALRTSASLYVRSGGAGSSVASDAVAGVTRALLLLGIASNTGGAVTFTPSANTLESVTAPSSVPTANTGITTGDTTTTGGNVSLRELVNAALYAIGRVAWLGSAALTPADANNWGAYSQPAYGLQKIIEMLAGTLVVNNIDMSGQLYHPDRVISVGIDQYDVIHLTSGSVGHVAGTAGITITNATVTIKLPPLPHWAAKLKKAVVFATGGGGPSGTLRRAPTDGTAYVSVTGAFGIALSGGAFTLQPTTPTVIAGAVYVAELTSGPAVDLTIHGVDLWYDVQP